MTVEAALLISFFLMSVNLLFYFFYLMEFQIELQFAMERNVREATINQTDNLPGMFTLQKAVRSELMEKGRGISLGNGGIRLVRNTNKGEEEFLDITAVFKAGPVVKLFGPTEGTYIRRCRRRFWTGQDFIKEKGEDAETETEYVYITQNGTVYHRNRGCTYLQLSVHPASRDALLTLRSKDGSKYKPCERCIKDSGAPETTYITDTGNRYHSSRNCSSLNRWIMKVSIEETGGKTSCSRCGGG